VQGAFQIAGRSQRGDGVARAAGCISKQHGSDHTVPMGPVRATGRQLRQVVQRPDSDGTTTVAGD